jgi:DNA modification methylase
METDTLWEDCLIILKDTPDNSIDAAITDPPYEINFMLRLGIKLEFPMILISGMNFFVSLVSLSQVLI